MRMRARTIKKIWKVVNKMIGRKPAPAPWKAALGGGLGLLGGTVMAAGALLYLSRLGRDVPRLERTLPSARQQFYSWRGYKVAYYVSGQGEPLLLCHSINAAASAFEMRDPFERLAQDFQVYAIDLLGFGASERPAGVRYSAELFCDLLRDFVRDVIGGPTHLIASSLSGAFAAAVAADHPDLLRSLVLVDPTGMVTLARPQGLGGRLIEGFFRLPVLGEAVFNLLTSRGSIRYFLAKAYGSPEKVEEALLEQSYVTAHQRGARFAPAAFVGRALNLSLQDVLPRLPERTLVVWTERTDYQDTQKERAAFAEVAPALEMQAVPVSGGLIYDEQPERFCAIVRDFILPRATPQQAEAPEAAAVSEIPRSPMLL